ncbi:hypothetical protein SUDANB180_03901 [Streptomyces sp. enrichment culture]
MLAASPAPRADSALTAGSLFMGTVPRGYVHRAAVAEVFLTGWEAAADSADSFVVRAQWPRGHALFAPLGGYQDPMLLVESIRQAGSLLAHAEYRVPFGHQFLMWDMSFTAEASAFAVGATPTDVELHVVCHDIVRRGGTVVRMRYTVAVRRAGRTVAGGTASFSCINPSVHRRLRGERPTSTGSVPPAPVDPAVLGRARRQDVLLAAPAEARDMRWELRVDTGHPILFDHPVDHVPGMVLIEAARQAARVATAQPDALLVGMESEFTRYTELDEPCWVEAHVEPSGAAGETRVRVDAEQNGEQVFTALLTLRRVNG